MGQPHGGRVLGTSAVMGGHWASALPPPVCFPDFRDTLGGSPLLEHCLMGPSAVRQRRGESLASSPPVMLKAGLSP